MNTNIGTLFDLCGVIKPVLTDNTIPSEDGKIYEIIRIIEGKPLFFYDHIKRMEASSKSTGLWVDIDLESLGNRIVSLCEANNYSICNVKVVGPMDDKGGLMVYVSAFSYPKEEVYQQGIDTAFLEIERPNPNAKLMRDDYKATVAKAIEDNNCYEVLLVSADGTVTEGSRSNTFFVKGDKVYTTPGELVLKGITRQYIMEACVRAGASLEERCVTAEECLGMDGLFISGTSIGVLPVRTVGSKTFSSPELPMILNIRKHYEAIVKENLL
ncbi:MAG: aminotransferase class IV [Clostridia bacterium]|nr:aminotransferase class IV [Clostridia bacterium]